MKPFTPLSLTLKGLSTSYGLEQGMTLHRLQRQWSEVVGPQIASHTDPTEARRGILYIAVDSAAWLHELSFFKQEILGKVNRFFGAGEARVNALHLKIGTLPPPPSLLPAPTKTLSPAIREADRAEAAWIEQQLTALTDPTLRDAISQAIQPHLRRS